MFNIKGLRIFCLIIGFGTSLMSNPTVNTNSGKVLGKISRDLDGKKFSSFQGIPYAKPPIGKLRFKDPRSAKRWVGTKDATKEGSACYARDLFERTTWKGSEDCLFLNVYTPELPSNTSKGLRPVMVWIHGGGFMAGSSSTDIYGPEYLLTQDIVMVSMNYRLGILGFLSLHDPSLQVPGNAALKDIVLALKWVQDNISNFGGDPKDVTIFGGSAGGAAVDYLLLSPMAKGLFHKAIAQSGVATNCFARGRRVAKELGELAHLKSTDEKEILKYFRSLTVEELLLLSEEIEDGPCWIDRIRPYGPVVEEISGPQSFISQEPIEILNSGNYTKVPFMLGYTTREGMLAKLFMDSDLAMPKDFQIYVPYFLNCVKYSESSKKIAEKLKTFYYGKPELSNDIDTHYLILSDAMFSSQIILEAIRHADTTSNAPVFLYRVSVETNFNLFKLILNITSPGVSHGDDLGFLFKTKLSPKFAPGSLEDTTIRRFVKLWANFAKYGDPNPKQKDNLIDVTWKPVSHKEINFLDIGQKLTPQVNPEPKRTQLWREILAIHPSYKF